MTSDADRRGADEPQGSGWWLASDGRYYPPDLKPGTGAAASNPKSVPAKKKVKKVKKVKAKARSKKVKKPASKPRAKTGSASRPDEPEPSVQATDLPPAEAEGEEDMVDITAQRAGQMKFTARPPATDQIAARQIQAKEQLSLLADARTEAALRIIAEEPVLVSAGSSAPRTQVPSPDELAQPARTTQQTEADQPEPTTAPASTPEPPTPEAPTAEPSTAATEPVARAAPPAVESPTTPPAESPATTPPTPAPETTSGPTPPPTPAASQPPAAPAPEGASPTPTTGSVAPPPPQRAMGIDVPFMTVKGSKLGTDIDRIGERMLIFADRVELRDRHDQVTHTIRFDQLADVEIHKKILGPTLVVRSRTGAAITAKALRPELATGAKAMVQKHAERFRRGEGVAGKTRSTTPVSGETPGNEAKESSQPGSVLLEMLQELHAAGILSDEELAAKQALVDPDS